MNYYFAPMEGLTDRIYRQLHHQYFPGITQYYTPFFSPTIHRTLTPKEQKELPPSHTLGYKQIPQILTKNPDDFLWMARQCRDLGYGEVNLNLGCPSGTVTAKGKGSALLANPEELDCFLYAIFSNTPLEISIKTRIGFSDSSQFPAIMDVFNRYPIKELTVHPRIRTAFYNGNVDMDAFRYAVENSRAPLCFNGNLCTIPGIQSFSQELPQVSAVMLGRGLLADPGMLSPKGTERTALEHFYNALLEAYLQAFGGSRNAMFRLKENWRYLICKFEGGEKLYKRLRKTTDLAEYRAITQEIFHTLPLREHLQPDW